MELWGRAEGREDPVGGGLLLEGCCALGEEARVRAAGSGEVKGLNVLDVAVSLNSVVVDRFAGGEDHGPYHWTRCALFHIVRVICCFGWVEKPFERKTNGQEQ